MQPSTAYHPTCLGDMGMPMTYVRHPAAVPRCTQSQHYDTHTWYVGICTHAHARRRSPHTSVPKTWNPPTQTPTPRSGPYEPKASSHPHSPSYNTHTAASQGAVQRVSWVVWVRGLLSLMGGRGGCQGRSATSGLWTATGGCLWGVGCA